MWNEEYLWDKERNENDIAILKLSEPLQFNENVQSACLPNGNELLDLQYSNQKCVTSGWGNNEGDQANSKLGIAKLDDEKKCPFWDYRQLSTAKIFEMDRRESS